MIFLFFKQEEKKQKYFFYFCSSSHDYRLIFGLENGLVVVDYISKIILMNMATADLYGTMNPFQRPISSPKRRGPFNDLNNDESSIYSSECQVNSFLFPFCTFFSLLILN